MKKRKRHSISLKFYFYEVCDCYIFLWYSSFYYDYNNTYFFPAIFVVSLTPGERISESIGYKYLSQIITRGGINGGGKGC